MDPFPSMSRSWVGVKRNASTRSHPEYPNHESSLLSDPNPGCAFRGRRGYHFVTGQTDDRGQLRMLRLVDENARECPWTDAERCMPAQAVVARLLQPFVTSGALDFIRSDNGPKPIATAVKEQLELSGGHGASH